MIDISDLGETLITRSFEARTTLSNIWVCLMIFSRHLLKKDVPVSCEGSKECLLFSNRTWIAGVEELQHQRYVVGLCKINLFVGNIFGNKIQRILDVFGI